jgi:hypothetical protein
MKVNLLVGSDDGVEIRVNGRSVHRNAIMRGLVADQDTVRGVVLDAGWNRLLASVENVGGDWGLSVNIVGEDGSPIRDLDVALDPR